MFTKLFWRVNLIKIDDLEVFESFYRKIELIYLEDKTMYLRLFSISDIVEFIQERIEPKNLICCKEHFPNESNHNNDNISDPSDGLAGNDDRNDSAMKINDKI